MNIIIKTEDSEYIHCHGVLGVEYTLCGLNTEVENFTTFKAEDTNEKINCPECILTIKYCKNIDKSQY